MDRTLLTLIAILSVLTLTQGHGYLANPPQRNSAWRAGFKTPTDHNDMANYCGGKGVQHSKKNGGKCGVCGEEFSKTNKRLEPGPANKYATGKIFANYEQGQTIDVTVKITAFHKGYFEFRLCENDVPQRGKDPSIAVTKECLDKNLLKSPTGDTRFAARMGRSTHKVVLASDVYCSACVLQWRYRTGNSWGCANRQCGSGRGPQEEFVGCSDIAISPLGPTTTPPTTQSSTDTPSSPTAVQSSTIATESSSEATTRSRPAFGQLNLVNILPLQVETNMTDNNPSSSATTTLNPPTRTKILTTALPAAGKSTPEKSTPQKEASTPKATKPQLPLVGKEDPKLKTPLTETTTEPTSSTQPSMKPSTTPSMTTKATVRPKPKKLRKVCRGKGLYNRPAYHSYCKLNCNHRPPHCPRNMCACRYV